MNKEQLMSRLKEHERWLADESNEENRRLIEDGLDFLKGDWSGCSMSCSILFDSVFDDCDLRDVDFFHAELQGSTFTRAKLANANLSKATIDGCSFDYAVMEHVAARRTVSINARFVSAVLANANLGCSRFIDADFSQANLSGADLTSCHFVDCVFYGVVLAGAKGVESISSRSTILVGSVNAPVSLHGDDAVAWMKSQCQPQAH